MDNTLCNNCGKYINNNQFLLHEAYCERSVIQCEKCHQNFDKNLQEIHDEEFHKKCTFCGEIYSAQLHKQHELNCDKKLEPCEYCKLPVSQQVWYEHREFCEGLTNNCTFCNKIIINKYIRAHELECFQKKTFANMPLQKMNIKSQTNNQKIEQVEYNYEDDEDLDNYYEQLHNQHSESLE